MLSKQEIFDTVTKHLATQGEQATINHEDDGPSCQYHAPDGGLKCAVGCLIPDDMYLSGMEGKTVSALFGEYPKTIQRIGFDRKKHLGLLEGLQDVHDQEFVGDWPSTLRRVGAVYALDTAIVGESFNDTEDSDAD